MPAAIAQHAIFFQASRLPPPVAIPTETPPAHQRKQSMNHLLTTTLSATLFATLALAGCGSGQDRTAATVQANNSVVTEVKTSQQDLDQVVGNLRNLRDADGNTDLKRSYADLKQHASDFNDALTEVQSGVAASLDASKTQITAWHTQSDAYTDPALRDSSAKRQADLRLASDNLTASMTNLNAATGAYKGSLAQIINALDQDLSQPGIQAIKPSVSKIIDGAPNMQDILADVAGKSQAVNAVLNP